MERFHNNLTVKEQMETISRNYSSGVKSVPLVTTKWRKKPVVIEAALLGEDKDSIINALKFISYINQELKVEHCPMTIDAVLEHGGIDIHTLEGTVKADFGDYIIKGIKGGFYPCKPDILALTYERELVWDENLNV